MSFEVQTKFFPFNASKWLSLQLLLDVEEMQKLLENLNGVFILPVGCVTLQGQAEIEHAHFLEIYYKYVESLKNGLIPDESFYRQTFSSALTVDKKDFYAQHVGVDKQIIRPMKPYVQMQSHHLNYSKADNKFHHMVFGNDSILWGVQLSYPQLCEDPFTYEAFRVDERFSNTSLFKSIQKWMREHTIPTPFIVDEKVINVPMRIGKNCLSWINNHPQLKQKNIAVKI